MWIVAGQRGELLDDENHHEIELRPQSAPAYRTSRTDTTDGQKQPARVHAQGIDRSSVSNLSLAGSTSQLD